MYKINYKIVIIVALLIFILCFINKQVENFSNTNPIFPIDIVYTWAGEKFNNDIRLSNNNELKYSLRSVFKYIPWVNHVYILMNPPKKIPSWFNDKYKEKITLVDHNETFNKKNLPNTNSNAIESTLVNIPGLSEHFIYLNDDIFFGNYVNYQNFFTKDGNLIIDQERVKNCSSMQMENKNKIVNLELPIYCGEGRHIPIPHKKIILRSFTGKYNEYVEWIRSIKSRKGRGLEYCHKYNLKDWCQQQHNLVAKFAYDNHNAIKKKFSDDEAVFIWNHDNNKKILNDIKTRHPMFFCINDKTFKTDEEKSKVYEEIKNFFEEFYSEKPFYEI